MRKTLFLVLLALVASVFPSEVQAAPTFGWANTIGGTGTDQAIDVAVDDSGNVISVGNFAPTVDFDPSGSTDSIATGDIYITKYASDGTYSWTKTLDGTNFSSYITVRAVTTDSNGDIYFTGGFGGTLDFDPSGSTDNHTGTYLNWSTTDIYVTKFLADGTYAWTKTMGSNTSISRNGEDIVVDSSDNVYVTGRFSGTVDFDPSGSTDNHTANDDLDLFVTKLSSAGAYGWTRTIGNTYAGNSYNEYGTDIAIDSSDNIYVTGFFQCYGQTFDFDPTAGTDTKTCNGNTAVPIIKITSDGDYGWTKLIDEDTENYTAELDGSSLFIDSSDNIYVSGYFYGSVDFDPSASTNIIDFTDTYANYVVKLNSSGEYQWANYVPTGNTSYTGVVADGDVFIAGYFTGTVDFDVSGSTDSKVSNGSRDLYLTQFSSSGAYVTTYTAGDTSLDYTLGLEIDSNRNIYWSGTYRGTVNFDIAGGTDNHTSNGGYDAFVSRHNFPDTTAPVISNLTAAVSSDATVTWTTDELASSQVEYGLTASYGTTTSETDTSPRVISHSVTLSSLVACSTYHYRVKSTDSALNTQTGSDSTFTTSGCLSSSTPLAKTSSTVTRAAGGSLTLTESSVNKIKLTIPISYGGSTDANFQIHRLTASEVTDSIAVRNGFNLLSGHIYNLSALTSNTALLSSFSSPITITMYYTDSEISGIQENTLIIHRWTGTEWQALSGCSVDTSANSISCTTSQFSVYALLGRASSASSSSSTALPDRQDKADILAMNGGVINRSDITTILDPNTIDHDIILSVRAMNKLLLSSRRFTYHSPIYRIDYRDFFNNAIIVPAIQKKSSIVAIHYTYASAELMPYSLLESKLKLAYSSDGFQWEILPTSVVDVLNKTVAAITKPYGYYAIVTSPDSNYINAPSIKGVSSIAKPNKIHNIVESSKANSPIDTSDQTSDDEDRQSQTIWDKIVGFFKGVAHRMLP